MHHITLSQNAVMMALLIIPFVAAQYGSSSSSTAIPLTKRGRIVGDRLILDDVQLTEIKGAWQNTGRRTPYSVEQATDNNTMPDCSVDKNNLSSYKGLDSGAGQYYILAGTGAVNTVTVNGQRTAFSANATYNSSLITVQRNGMPSCTHFAPYVDLHTGELMAESISITEWTLNATTNRAMRTKLNCDVSGTEEVGCYIGRNAADKAGPAPINSAALSVAPAPISSGVIRTVVKNTFTCLNGECLRLDPKYSTTSPAYGCN